MRLILMNIASDSEVHCKLDSLAQRADRTNSNQQ